MVILREESRTVYAWIDGKANVTFDASDSRGPQADNLSYIWHLDGEPVATGIAPAIKLSVGKHTITLIVNDGVQDSERSEFGITVIEPLEVESRIFPPTTGPFKFKSEVMAMLRLPPAIARGEIDLDQPLQFHPGGAEASHQYVMRWRRRRTLCANVFAFFSKDVLTHAAPDGGFVKLSVAGRFKMGRYFYGSDTVRVGELRQAPMLMKS